MSRHAVMASCAAHVVPEEFFGLDRKLIRWKRFGVYAHGGSDRVGERFPEERCNRIADLAKAVPDCPVELEPIGIGVQPCRFSDRDATRNPVVDRSRCSVGSPVARRSRSQGVTQALRRQLEMSSNVPGAVAANLAIDFSV